MANLAILGHKTRGKEVIEILKMLGGNNIVEWGGDDINAMYFINEKGNIGSSIVKYFSAFVFSLEEFLKRFPYKVGDRVRVAEYESEVRIDDMKWDGNEIQYEVFTDTTEWYSAEELNLFNEPFNEPFKEETMEERENNVVVNIEHKQLKINSLRFNKTQLMINDEYELKQEGDDYYIVHKKPEYPKLTNLTECREILGDKDMFQGVSGYKSKLLTNFQRLIIFRDAYWKIAGEQMGLDKPWEPDWSTEHEIKYVIEVYRNNVRTNSQGYSNTILTFPTTEMRDAFYENFKELIKECKELL